MSKTTAHLGAARAHAGATPPGLEAITSILLGDAGLRAHLSAAQITAAATAADGMNGILVDGIHTLGLAEDGLIDPADLRDLSAWIRADVGRSTTFTSLYGDGATGFDAVVGHGAKATLHGKKVVDTIAHGIYDLGFGIVGGSVVDEDGHRGASLSFVSGWMSTLLADDLAAAAHGGGPLHNAAVVPADVPRTGTGLDAIVDIIFSDPGLQTKASLSDLVAGAEAATAMNTLILDAIDAYGLVDDGDFSEADVRAVNTYITAGAQPGASAAERARYATFLAAHGDDADHVETGFHRVRGEDGTVFLYGKKAINSIYDSIYHVGFDIVGHHLVNEDGERNATLANVAKWISSLLADDIASGTLVSGHAPTPAPTHTGLDRLVDAIADDRGLGRWASTLDIAAGTESAAAMNGMIVAAIAATHAAADGVISTDDVREISDWLGSSPARHAAFASAYGDAARGTGFQSVVHDHASGRLFGENAVDVVADGIYQLGGDIVHGAFVDADGGRGASLVDVAGWLDALL